MVSMYANFFVRDVFEFFFVYAFLFRYMDVPNSRAGMDSLREWTNALLRHTLRLGGKFYLPYLRVYDRELITQMYDFAPIRALKVKYDRQSKLFSQYQHWLLGN